MTDTKICCKTAISHKHRPHPLCPLFRGLDARRAAWGFDRQAILPFNGKTARWKQPPACFAGTPLKRGDVGPLHRGALVRSTIVQIANFATGSFFCYASFRMNRTPRVPGPQWLETVQPAVVTQISRKACSSRMVSRAALI